MEKIAIYSRKSKFTGKGESIENQIEMCRNYILMHYPEANDIVVYEDEGYSGKNTNRPEFTRLMEDCKAKKIEMIICYRLDRISRNIVDFAKLVEELNALNIGFESIKEKFDTSSSMGRAMMYISSVFSQLERETIAERIRDNMHELAKYGRWLGGHTPTGYKSEPIEKVTVDGKIRRMFKLEFIKDEIELIKKIYEKFIETNSLTKVETYLLQNYISTKNGNKFTRFSIKNILQNPVYMIADENAWEYFQKEEIEIYSEHEAFDSVHGIMAYNKTLQQNGKTNQTRDMSEWIIAVGKHKGIISGLEWVKVQNMLEQNKSKSYRKPKSHTALLSGIIYCGKCGSYMRPKMYNTDYSEGEKRFSYLCETKEKSKVANCDCKNPNGNVLDRLICEEIKKLSEDSSEFFKKLEEAKKDFTVNTAEYDKQLDSMKAEFSANESEINNLVATLGKSEGKALYGYIEKQIEELHNKNEGLKTKISDYEELTKENELSDIEFDLLADILRAFGSSFETMGIEQKRSALRTFIKKIIWDGQDIHLYLFGATDDEIEYPTTNTIPIDTEEPSCNNSK